MIAKAMRVTKYLGKLEWVMKLHKHRYTGYHEIRECENN
jgi:hypothetical protein